MSIKCLHCGNVLTTVLIDPKEIGRMGGLKKSRAKTLAAKRNGKLGGRPKKSKV